MKRIILTTETEEQWDALMDYLSYAPIDFDAVVEGDDDDEEE